jgi:hypothetical protein
MCLVVLSITTYSSSRSLEFNAPQGVGLDGDHVSHETRKAEQQ